MPWTASQAKKHTRKASTRAKQKLWMNVANSVMRRTGDEGRAVRMANAAVKKKARTRRR